jgi:D-lactate dehydrogenase
MTYMPKVAIFSASLYVKDQMQPLVDRWPGSKFIDCPCSGVTAELAQGCTVACLFVNDDCSKEVVDVFERIGVRMVAMRCAGFDRVDVPAVKSAGIQIARVPAYSPYAVAEHAVTLAMCLNRKIHRSYLRVREGNFTLSGLVGFDMRGKTVGIVGTGKIGTTAARCFKGFGMDLLGFDKHHNEHFKEIGEYVSLDELCARSDIISLHTPLMPATKHMVNKELIDKMKHGVILVNCSRGGLIQTEDLIEGIHLGKIDAVGLDVYEEEDALFFQDFVGETDKVRMKHWDMKFAKLASLPSVVITPHTAFLTKEALTNICNTTISSIEEFIEGKPLTNAIRA